MIAQPQQMELDAIRGSRIPTITITTRCWSLSSTTETKTVDVFNIIVRANGKIISVRNPADWYYYETLRSTDGGISDFFLTNNIVNWHEGTNTITYDEANVGSIVTGAVYKATDAFNASTGGAELIEVKLNEFGLTKSGDTINIQYSVTVETV